MVASCRGNLDVNRLSLVRVRNGKDVSEGGESECEAQNKKGEPETVNEGREFLAEDVRAASEEESDDASEAKQDNRCSCGTVAGVALVD